MSKSGQLYYDHQREFGNLEFNERIYNLMEPLDTNLIDNIEWDGIDSNDYPDFVDAFAVAFDYGDRDATDEEIDYFNDNLIDIFYDDLYQSMV